MTKENFFTRLFSFFKKKPKIEATTSQTSDKLLKRINDLEADIATYKKEITTLEQQLSQKEKVQFSGSEIGEKYLALKTDFEAKEKELKKLKKEVDDLQEEVDDLEDDKKEQKKKFDRELNQKIEEFQKSLNQLTAEKENLTNKLKDLEADKKLKSDSISFVNNILNARDADSKDYKYIFDKTTEICSYIQNEVTDVFKNILNRPMSDVQSNLYKWRNT